MAETRQISFAEAVRDALAVSMERSPEVFLLGEGIADPTSFFGTTKGLADEFGPQRAIEMPISENALMGVAIGAAMNGQRPVVSMHRVEFSLLALEQIFNNAAKSHYVSNGRHRVPLVLRLIVGRGWGQGPEHSQSLESVFAHVPGLKVVMPAFPADAKGMLVSAIADDNPVISIEHRWLHATLGQVPSGYASTPLDGPRIVRAGDRATVVATSYMTIEALRAADFLARQGCSVEVVDLRVLRPLDVGPIVESVRRTGALITVDTGWRTYGVGAEICAQVVEQCFAALRCAPVRLGLPDHPTPSSRGLVPGFYVDSAGIVEAVGRVLPDDAPAVAAALAAVREANAGREIDVPGDYFKGPF